MYNEFIVFDIETCGKNWDEFSESQQEYLLRNAQTEEEIEKRKFELALTPMTGKIVCIGMQRVVAKGNDIFETESKIALCRLPEGQEVLDNPIEIAENTKMYVFDEKKMLETFWKALINYPNGCLVSFNGRNFDAPYLMLRSAVLGIRPTRNLMEGTKFNYNRHIDLIDELTFYSGSAYGASKRFNFDFYTREFGITSPKAEGVDGSKVSDLYNEGSIENLKIIAEYCMRDVNATWLLFEKWNSFLNFRK